MAKKISLREQRRLAREMQRRKQRTYAAIAVAAAAVFIGLLAFLGWNRQRLESAAATATTVAQMATNTVIAATRAVQSTASSATQSALATASGAAQATSNALAASIEPMKFPGVPTDTVKTSSGLEYKDVVVGSGPESVTGNTVEVHYTGWLTDGTQFDSSVDGGQPFQVTLGSGSVIKGWEEGLQGMKVGGRRILVIPPDLGYGEAGSPPTIPANATLIFEIVLIGIR